MCILIIFHKMAVHINENFIKSSSFFDMKDFCCFKFPLKVSDLITQGGRLSSDTHNDHEQLSTT